MRGEIEDEQAFIAELRFALRDVPIVRSQQQRRAESWRDLVAGRIVAQLKRANWFVRRGTPSPGTNATDQELAAIKQAKTDR